MFYLEAYGFIFVDWDYQFILYVCKQAVMIGLELYRKNVIVCVVIRVI